MTTKATRNAQDTTSEGMLFVAFELSEKTHTPPDLVVRDVTAHRKPPDVRICRLRHQSAVGTRPPSTSTPHCPACRARR